MSTTGSTNVIRLADRRPGHVAGTAGQAANAAMPPLNDMDGALWESLLRIGGRLQLAACEIKSGKTDRIHASTYLWRIGEVMEEMANRASRLERKLRKAKKGAKRRA